MLFKILNSDDLTYEDLIEVLEKYKSKNYIKEQLYTHKEHENNDNIEALNEINKLFIEIIENHRNIPMFKEYLNDIYKFTNKTNIKDILGSWKEFEELFKGYNNLIENCIVSKVLSSCTIDDLEEMIISFEMIILEYILIRHALFLRYCSNRKKEIAIQEIKDYIVIFSRIIGNNSDAVIEFLLDLFESEILEFKYISKLLLS